MYTSPRKSSCCLVLKYQGIKLDKTRNLGFHRNNCAYGGGESRKPAKNQGEIQGSRKPSVFFIYAPKRAVHTPSGEKENHYRKLVCFGRACALVRCAHPSFSAHCHIKQGAARPPPIAALLLIIWPPKNKQNLSAFFFPRSLAPSAPIVASLILSAIFWCQNVPVRPFALTF